MIRTRPRRAAPLALLLVLAACTSTTGTDGASPSATPEPTLEPSATESASPEATASGEASASPDESAGPSSTPMGGEPGGFTFESNAEADALFINRFSCQNLDDGYEVDYPSEWNANAEVGPAAQCSWFAATEYAAGDGRSVPDEVAIEIFVVDGDRGYHGDIVDRREGFIGVTQAATRVRVMEDGVEHYEYVVQLGPSPEEGPNLVARTSSEMGDDFDLNRAVLDRMMATMEFIGVIQ